jgi:hypothetical protein
MHRFRILGSKNGRQAMSPVPGSLTVAHHQPAVLIRYITSTAQGKLQQFSIWRIIV